MKIPKFGGMSVGTARRVREVAELMHAPQLQRRIVVLSAMSGLTATGRATGLRRSGG